MDINILAFESFGNEMGRDYFAKDLEGDDQIVILFDLCQILQAYITPEGWRHLFSNFGIKRLYGIDKISGWLNTDDPEDWIQSLYYESLISGYYPTIDAKGKWDQDSGMFNSSERIIRVNWQEICDLHSLLD